MAALLMLRKLKRRKWVIENTIHENEKLNIEN
jgi:hypothetical protein